MFRSLGVLTALLCAPTEAARKCYPETRCRNSPDEGLSSISTFNVPIGVSGAELQAYYDGLATYGVNGTLRCEYGHIDLAGALLTPATVRLCPQGDGACGWTKTYYDCTCTSREMALAAYDPSGYWGTGGYLTGFGSVLFLMFGAQSIRDYRNGREFSPGCDCDEAGVFRFWFVLLVAIAVPIGLIAGGAYQFSLASRDRNDPGVVGYFHGCGNYYTMSPINPGGTALFATIGAFFGGSGLFLFCYILWDKRSERRRSARTLEMRGRTGADDTAVRSIADARSRVREARAGGANRSRPLRLAQHSARRIHEISLELTSPVRIARVASAGRLELGGGRAAEFSVRRQKSRRCVAVAQARVEVHSGWLKRLLPSHISGGPPQERFFVLYDTAELHYYESESQTGEALGKLNLSKVPTDEDGFKRLKPDSATDFSFRIKIGGRACPWDCDPGSEEKWRAWEEKLVPMVRGGAVVAAAVVAATPVGSSEGSGPVVFAAPVVAVAVDEAGS